jgi:RNA polymerase sigma factor (sigma-70 family)
LVTDVSEKKSVSDREIVASVRGGDHRAEGLLVQRYYGRVLARACGKVGDPEAAADITQEVILGVLCALREGRLRSADRLAQYVSATITNVVRRHRTRRESSPDVDLTGIVSDAPLPDELAGWRERLGAVARAFGELSERDRGILALLMAGGMTSREVAQCTGLSPALVRQRKARALTKLRGRVSCESIGKTGEESSGTT